MNKHPLALWTCHKCTRRIPWGCEEPEKIEKLNIIYDFSDGVRGAPPFSKPYNDGPIIGELRTCMNCILKEKMGIKDESTTLDTNN